MMAKKKTHGLTWHPQFDFTPRQRTKAGSDIQWKTSHVELRNSEGQVYFAMRGVRAPEFWSSTAVEIAAAKYFRKRGVPKGKGVKGQETSVAAMVTRVSRGLCQSGSRQGYFATTQAAQLYRWDLEYLLYHQYGSFNSPVWFNAGLFSEYGIASESRCYAWDSRRQKVQERTEAYERPQLSACFIQKVEDHLDSIFDLVHNEARLFKFGSGSGTNFSNLRSRYESLAGGGKSSGLISFLEVFDKSAGSIKSGGTTRRAAKMVILDIDHPEIEDFIQWKSREEKKAKKLIEAGFDAHFEGEAYRTVSGQNSNNSIRIPAAFFRALEKDQMWSLRDRLHGRSLRKVRAKDLWQQIAQAAWECADPGLQFDQAIQHWHTCAATAPIRASNPCSEYLFLDDSACNLASLNLLRFLDDQGEFQQENFLAAARVFFIAQDIIVDWASYPTATIAANSHDYRPLGLGMTGFGAFLMRKGIPYDSPEAREWGAVLAALLTGVAYSTSAELARLLGSFPGWRRNKAAMAKVIKQHAQAVRRSRRRSDENQKDLGPQANSTARLWKKAEELWAFNVKCAGTCGFRNAQATVMAPTGTISFIMDSETTGIEPEYALLRKKSFAGGGVMTILSPSMLATLKGWLLSEERIQEIKTWVYQKGTLQGCPLLTESQQAVFKTALEILPETHLEMMAAVQPFISGAISKTVNLPQETTPQEVADIYLKAWRLGLKAIAVYRDHSKGFQPMTMAQTEALPKCDECGTQTELSGGCFRCPNCGTVVGCS